MSGGAVKQRRWTKDEEALMFEASLTYEDIAEITGYKVESVRSKVSYMRKRGTLVPNRNANAHALMMEDADNVFGQPFLENGGYWEPDGFTFRACTRCGINMRLEVEWERDVRAFCEGCNYKDFRAPFESGSAVEYLSVAAA